MADTVTLTTIAQTKKRLVVSVHYVSDGTGVTDTVVVDRSTFTGMDGTEPGSLVVEQIEFSVDGVQLRLEFDGTSDVPIANLTGSGYFDFTQGGRFAGQKDTATGATGDIIMTSVGHSAGDQGTIVLYLRKKD